MAKFAIKCPQCGKYATASNFLHRKVKCTCGYEINVKTDRVTSRHCHNCNTDVIYDQSKPVCPVCGEDFSKPARKIKTVTIHCPTCACEHIVEEGTAFITCPLCETEIDVENQHAKETLQGKGNSAIIKYEGPVDSLVWRHPMENFNIGTQLIVNDSQEAILFRNGVAYDAFTAGRYTIEKKSLPKLGTVYNIPDDADVPFHSEVYFVNKTVVFGVKWGTTDKVNFIDPFTNAPMSIGARGLLNFSISDSRKFLLKIVGMSAHNEAVGNIFSEIAVRDYFRSVILLAVSTNLASIITTNKIDVLQIDERREEFSKKLKEVILPYFSDYGIEISNFLVEGLLLPQKGEYGYDTLQTIIKLRQQDLKKTALDAELQSELDEMERRRTLDVQKHANATDVDLAALQRKKTVDIQREMNQAEVESVHRQTVVQQGQTSITEAQLEAQRLQAEQSGKIAAERMELDLEMERKRRMAEIEIMEMQGKGYNQKDVLQAQVMSNFAKNSNGGGMSGMAGEALSFGMGVSMMNNAVSNANEMFEGNSFGVATNGAQQGWNCSCGATNISTPFCPQCGAKKPEEGWNCSNCGQTNIKTPFCPSCGKKKED